VTQISKTILKRRTNFEDQHIWIPKLNYKATIIKTLCFQHKDRHAAQRNSMGSPEINSDIYGWLNFQKGQDDSMEKEQYSTNGAGHTTYSHTED
jgi:hypothetical protein